MLKVTRVSLSALSIAAALCTMGASALSNIHAQDASQKSSEKILEKNAKGPQQKPTVKTKPEIPAEIELLETRVRFEPDGSSRKEVHARVMINDELGVRQFARLSFDFNRSYQQIEIPLVRITHPSGGTIDVLPSAITDEPNPAVVNATAYQDARVKSVRILGLEPHDTLEYRVLTTTSHAPLAPDFWLEHTFDRSGVVSHENFELDLPASRLADSPNLHRCEIRVNPLTPAETRQVTAPDGSARSIYHWQVALPGSPNKLDGEISVDENQSPDIAVSSFPVWGVFSQRFAEIFHQAGQANSSVADKAIALTKTLRTPREKLEALYGFVSQKVSTVDLPLGATGFRTRLPVEILSSGYATPEDKFVLLAALASSLNIQLEAALTRISPGLPSQLPSPSLFTNILTVGGTREWLDPSLEVAPFGLLTPALRGKQALWLRQPPNCGPLADCAYSLWATIPVELPFAASQRVHVDAVLGPQGTFRAKLAYTLRSDNELLLRVAFHRTPRENWKNVAQLLALSDGFRGQITNVTASDPYETRDPFTVEFEISQPKFVNWSKTPLRIPALLPVLGLPDPAEKAPAGASGPPIDMGTPLDVEVTATVHLPAGTTATAPAGTSIERDFATYTSQYSAKDSTLTASRHLNFILRKIPADRAGEYNAFLQAVQNDESQFFTLDRAKPGAANPQKP
ncbi:MAG: DUF3857 domain-containing protein [Candidatus Acidiferrum sp.]